MAGNSAKEENLLSRLGAIRNAVDETKKLRDEVARLEDHLRGCREEREAAEACRAKAEAEVERLREALGVRERMQEHGSMDGTIEEVLKAHRGAADWLLSTDPSTVPQDVWVREFEGVRLLLDRLCTEVERLYEGLRAIRGGRCEGIAGGSAKETVNHLLAGRTWDGKETG